MPTLFENLSYCILQSKILKICLLPLFLSNLLALMLFSLLAFCFFTSIDYCNSRACSPAFFVSIPRLGFLASLRSYSQSLLMKYHLPFLLPTSNHSSYSIACMLVFLAGVHEFPQTVCLLSYQLAFLFFICLHSSLLSSYCILAICLLTFYTLAYLHLSLFGCKHSFSLPDCFSCFLGFVHFCDLLTSLIAFGFAANLPTCQLVLYLMSYVLILQSFASFPSCFVLFGEDSCNLHTWVSAFLIANIIAICLLVMLFSYMLTFGHLLV